LKKGKVERYHSLIFAEPGPEFALPLVAAINSFGSTSPKLISLISKCYQRPELTKTHQQSTFWQFSAAL
jgi:hypothetical protein